MTTIESNNVVMVVVVIVVLVATMMEKTTCRGHGDDHRNTSILNVRGFVTGNILFL